MRLLVPADDETRETEISVRFDADQLVLCSAGGGGDLKIVPYTQIQSAIYSYSEGPRRWKSGVIVGVAAGPLALPVIFMKGKKHWLTVKTARDYTVLRLEKGLFKSILSEFSARSGVKVEEVGREVKAVAMLGVGAMTPVIVQLRDLTEVKGTVSEAGDDTFVVQDRQSRRDKTIAYSEVTSIRPELSAHARLAIGFTVGWWVFWTVAGFFV